MIRYALLLRGVNLGKGNSLPMAELRAMLGTVGCADIKTYVQSGNAVFRSSQRASDLIESIETLLERYMGRRVATTLRTRAQMNAIVDANPFVDVPTNPACLCVTFLSETPTNTEIAPLSAVDFAPELFRLSGKEIYTWHPNGQARSALAAAISKLRLRGTITTRNWNTVQKLFEMLSES